MKTRRLILQIDGKLSKDLRAYAHRTDRSISSVVSDAIAEYLGRTKVRSEFKSTMNEVLKDHVEIIKKLTD